MSRSSILSLAALVAAFVTGLQAQQVERSRSLAPYVPTPQSVLEKLLEAAEIKPGEVVYDLGSGDGRVLITAAKKYRARAVGVEISPKLVRSAMENIKREGLADRCQVIHGDLLEVDVSDADVVVLYLLTSSNEEVRPRLEKYLKPGSRVVSHDFEVRGWKAERIEQAKAHNRMHYIYVYRMPTAK